MANSAARSGEDQRPAFVFNLRHAAHITGNWSAAKFECEASSIVEKEIHAEPREQD
jgi:hypothetical protein